VADRKDRWADDRTSRVWIQGDLDAENFGTYMDGSGVLIVGFHSAWRMAMSTCGVAEFSSKWRTRFSHLRGGCQNQTVVQVEECLPLRALTRHSTKGPAGVGWA